MQFKTILIDKRLSETTEFSLCKRQTVDDSFKRERWSRGTNPLLPFDVYKKLKLSTVTNATGYSAECPQSHTYWNNLRNKPLFGCTQEPRASIITYN